MKLRTLIKNKKAQFGVPQIVFFVGILFLLMFVGMIMAFGGLTLDWTFDEATPIFTSLGMAGEVNMSQVSGYTVTPINNVVQSFTWLSGVLYVMAIVGMLGLSTAFRINGNKWIMAFFFCCMILLIIGSIFISNIYEEFYNTTGDVGDRLHEYGLLSFLLLYSPMVMCVIGFVGGIIMFTGNQDGEI